LKVPPWQGCVSLGFQPDFSRWRHLGLAVHAVRGSASRADRSDRGQSLDLGSATPSATLGCRCTPSEDQPVELIEAIEAIPRVGSATTPQAARSLVHAFFGRRSGWAEQRRNAYPRYSMAIRADRSKDSMIWSLWQSSLLRGGLHEALMLTNLEAARKGAKG
jgi:hypothetical protein